MDYYCLSLASGKANKQTKPTHQVHGQMNSRGINRSVNLLIQTRFVLTTGWEQAHEQLLWNRKCSKFTAFTNYPAEARPAACMLWATPHQCETCNSRQRVCNIFLRAVVQGLDPHTDASPADRSRALSSPTALPDSPINDLFMQKGRGLLLAKWKAIHFHASGAAQFVTSSLVRVAKCKCSCWGAPMIKKTKYFINKTTGNSCFIVVFL